jgi:hypothetical protein
MAPLGRLVHIRTTNFRYRSLGTWRRDGTIGDPDRPPIHFSYHSQAYLNAGVDGAQGAYVRFETTANGGVSKTEKMRLVHDGKLGIGLTNPTYQLQLSSDSAAKPSTNTWTVASDGRLKDPESIEPFTEGSDLIRKLPNQSGLGIRVSQVYQQTRRLWDGLRRTLSQSHHT